MDLIELLKRAIERDGSDIFVVPGAPVMAKIKGKVEPLSKDRVLPADTANLVYQAYALASRDSVLIEEAGDDDFSFSVKELSRFRCNAYKQRGTLAATLRVVKFGLPDPAKLHIPDMVMDMADLRNGMVLVTGTAGSGKSTTLACMIERINNTREGHIVTIEDPIEYLHSHKKCIVSQREVPSDASTFDRALRAALRQAPDVIMLGEMRDAETIRTAITAAETGQLLLSSLHTVGAANAVDRIIDAFPAGQQQQIRVQLSMVLRAVVSQRLLVSKKGGLVPVFEVMTVTPAIRNMIRDAHTHQMDNVIATGAGHNMMSMDNELFRLVKSGDIDRDTALTYAINSEMLSKRI